MIALQQILCYLITEASNRGIDSIQPINTDRHGALFLDGDKCSLMNGVLMI
jgi:hypothetical protein